jgi:hypothetical protein
MDTPAASPWPIFLPAEAHQGRMDALLKNPFPIAVKVLYINTSNMRARNI